MKRIGRLTYRIKLLFIIKIHDVIFVVYFEPVTIFVSDPYGRYFIIPLFVIVDNEKKYEIERLVRKRQRRYGRAKQTITKYLAR